MFDLDDTLLDTSSWLIPIAHSPLFQERISQPLPLMPGARENLDYLSTKYDLFLLTLGQPQVQEKKVTALNLQKYFREMLFANTEAGETKESFFQKLSGRVQSPSSILSIGNRRSQDIRFAKRHGMKTCLFDYGEHQQEKPEGLQDHADFEVHNHFELVRRCQL